VQVSADDDGGSPQGGQESQGSHQAHGSHESHEGHQAHDAQQSHGRPAHRSDANGNSNNQPQSRPGTGADTGYSIPSDADADPAIPPEAVSALKEVGQTPDQDMNGDQGARRMTAAVGRAAKPAAGTSQLTLRTTAGTNAARSVILRCDPPGGTHPKAADACADVAKSQGDLKQMPASSNPRACFMIYAPVTVSAQGNWRGQPLQFTAQFPNTCVMRDKTGSIFDF
jgi:hypothetical protein